MELLSSETQSTAAWPKAPSTPILADSPTWALGRKTPVTLYWAQFVGKVAVPATRGNVDVLGFDVSSEGEVRGIPVVDVAFQTQRKEGGHVDAQFDGQTRQRR